MEIKDLRLAYDGHVYKLVGTKPYTRKDGVEIELLIWQGTCADCGAFFEVNTPTMVNPRRMNRRCALHVNPKAAAGPLARKSKSQTARENRRKTPS